MPFTRGVIGGKTPLEKVNEYADFWRNVRARCIDGIERCDGRIRGKVLEHFYEPTAANLLADQPFRDQDQSDAGTCCRNERFAVVREERSGSPNLDNLITFTETP